MNRTIILLVALAALGLALADGAAALPPVTYPDLPSADCEPDADALLDTENETLLDSAGDACG